MNEDATCGLFILIFDALLGAALWAGLLLLRVSHSSFGLGAVWAYGAVKWACLSLFTSVLTDKKPPAVLRRLAALLCLLSPVVESGRVFMAPPSQPYPGASTDLRALLLSPACAALACVIWEEGLCGSGRTRRGGAKLDSRQLLVRMLKYFRPDTLHLVAAFSALILGVVCDSYVPLYQGQVVDMLRERELHADYGRTLACLALVYVGSALFAGVRGGMFMCVLSRLNKRLRLLLFRSLLRQEVTFFEENSSGTLCARLHSDVDRMGRTVALNANAAVRSTVKALLMLHLMLGLSWELTLLTCIEMPLHAAVQNKYSSISRELKDQMQDCQARIKDQASQIIGGIQTVRSFRAEKDELSRYCRAVEQMSAVKRRSGINSIVFGLIRRLMTLALHTLMLIQARRLVTSGQLTIGSLVSFLLYQKPMLHSLKEVLYSLGDTASTVGVISKVFGYFDRTPRCRPEGDLEPERLQGGVVFRDVTFCYPSAPETPVLKSVSVKLSAGKMTALVGPSGSGKTSFVSLLKRLYEPQGGRILLDGEELHRYRRRYFHQKVALVSQNPVLFSGSRRYNMEYGTQGGVAQDVVEDAARRLNALDLLDDQDSAEVGERGAKLAESQRKCIAVIRALVRDPQVVVLDEATSKLDVDMQRAVLQEVLARRRTVLVVSHQLETVEKADHIIYLEGGEVVEEGTHQQLMARRGRYYHQKEKLFAPPS
ncbi:unnamed protein product [Ophioblennius macclurei]